MTTQRRIVKGDRITGDACEGPVYEECLRLFFEGRGEMWTGYDWWFEPLIVQTREVAEWVDTDDIARPDGPKFGRPFLVSITPFGTQEWFA